jgi:hypothetical protein
MRPARPQAPRLPDDGTIGSVEGLVDFRVRTEANVGSGGCHRSIICVAVFAEIFWRLGLTQP